MDTNTTGYNHLFDEATVLYQEAKQVEAVLATLSCSSVGDWISERIGFEAAENKKLRDMLDGFFAAWKQISTERCVRKYHRELDMVLKRIRSKRATSGCHAAIFVAAAKENDEIARILKQAVMSIQDPSLSLDLRQGVMTGADR